MAIYAQPNSPGKSTLSPSAANPMSIICTGPVIPSVIYHHHMYYLSSPNVSGNSSGMPYQQTLPTSLLLPNVSTLMNNFVESVVSSQPPGNGSAILGPRLTVPVTMPISGYSPTWLVEPSVVKMPASFLSQIDAPTLDRSKGKEVTCKSSCASSSCSASSSSYFASLSSLSSACLSPHSSTSSSSPSSSSSTPTNSPSSHATSDTPNSTDSSKSEHEQKDGNSLASSTASSASQCPANGAKQPPALGFLQTLPSIRGSSLTPSTLATPFLSANVGAFMPGAYFSAPGGSLSSQATEVISAALNNMAHVQPTTQPALSYRDYYARFGVHYTPAPWNQSYGMERVWMSEFRRIFSSFYNEMWSIQPVERKPGGIKLHMFVDSAKVRFCCDKCGHSWTSMKGRIVFWFNLLPPNFNIGIVTIKLFGQKCESCKTEVYEQPMWYPEEVTKVLMNLFNRVGQIFYGFEKTKFEKQRRMGKPRTPHNKYLCQACLEGICLSRRRACTAAGQQVPPCPTEELNRTNGLESTHQLSDTSPTSDTPSDEFKGDIREQAISERRIKVEEEDEAEHSEDSGIMENDAERARHTEPKKAIETEAACTGSLPAEDTQAQELC